MLPEPQDVAEPGASKNGLRYRPELDGIRAIAVLIVIGAHVVVDERGLPGLYGRGWLGVSVFFVLSGYLITALLEAERERSGRVSLSRFYTRRALRLLPCFIAVLVACAVWSALDPAVSLSGGGILSPAIYVENWAQLHRVGAGMLDHTWSLSVEEQFYLLWPPLLGVLLVTFGRRWATRVVLLLAGASVAWRILLLAHGVDGHRLLLGSDTAAVALLLGCWLALSGARPSRGLTRVCMFGLGWLLLVGGTEPFQYQLGPLLAAIATVGVLTASPMPLRRRLGSRPLVAIGRRSYGLYLWHFPVFFVVAAHFHPSRLGFAVVAVPVTFVIAWLSYYWLESPLLRLKDRVRASA